MKELGSESPMLVRLIMKSIHKQNKREVKHIGCKRFGIQYLLKGIYTHNGLLYFHTEIKDRKSTRLNAVRKYQEEELHKLHNRHRPSARKENQPQPSLFDLGL